MRAARRALVLAVLAIVVLPAVVLAHPLGNFTNTSPATTSMLTRSRAIGSSVPGEPTSQASPTPSRSPSAWSAFGTAVQLSLVSGAPSPSASGAAGTGCGNGGPATAHVYTAGVLSSEP